MRLIDADKLKQAIPETKVDAFENCGNCTCLTDEQVKELIDEAPTIEALKEHEPRVLTIEETINAKYPMDVFAEVKEENRIFAVTAPIIKEWVFDPNIRFWTERPTEEQRKKEKWFE